MSSRYQNFAPLHALRFGGIYTFSMFKTSFGSCNMLLTIRDLRLMLCKMAIAEAVVDLLRLRDAILGMQTDLVGCKQMFYEESSLGTYTHIHTCAQAYIHTCRHTYIHTYTHTYNPAKRHKHMHAYDIIIRKCMYHVCMVPQEV